MNLSLLQSLSAAQQAGLHSPGSAQLQTVYDPGQSAAFAQYQQLQQQQQQQQHAGVLLGANGMAYAPSGAGYHTSLKSAGQASQLSPAQVAYMQQVASMGLGTSPQGHGQASLLALQQQGHGGGLGNSSRQQQQGAHAQQQQQLAQLQLQQLQALQLQQLQLQLQQQQYQQASHLMMVSPSHLNDPQPSSHLASQQQPARQQRQQGVLLARHSNDSQQQGPPAALRSLSAAQQIPQQQQTQLSDGPGPVGPSLRGPPADPTAGADGLGDGGGGANLPPVRALLNWRATFAASLQPHDVLPPDHPGKGTEGLSELRLGAFEVLVADTSAAADVAVAVLRSRMYDGVVAMDTEVQPDSGRGDDGSPIVLLQLAAAGLVVVLRPPACGGLPRSFLTLIVEDTDIELVVPTWSNTDERNFEESFGLQTFWCRIAELQKVAKACGHSKTSVKALLQAVLEPTATMPKTKKLSATDWAASTLPPEVVKHAVLNAACVEHIFRCLEVTF
ncbi:hypothetical protein HYH03_008160 [Edaphochlamys debaryana]|uniref:3'-5' exonuclease domain-containing protein n=1 Tax=Edaphochlamys debaryana TaxID=47281 RepID=A0A835Y2U4_9CHLO|nr:hypothetical protein HYH03_008160 [Edaphochlamys debaryana]|eukprot:KAG2493643.1 hypothetical protein HYH03_008160 [Edaphochlamys debaryana]